MNTPLLKRIVSITELRRNFGELTENLAEVEELILTKGGEPFAILKSTPNEKAKILKKAAGAWEKTALDSDRVWKEVFKRRSRKEDIVL
ncbi:MAG: hypothetical protein AAB599_00065 [Patescibacteria group bacterium]